MQSTFPILVVDDDPAFQIVVEQMLLSVGYQVACCNSAQHALAILEKEHYPIVLTDWLMPEMTGTELCQALRQQPRQAYVYIIMLSSLDSKTEVIAGLESGADDYLTKPIIKAELLARLKTAERILTLEQALKQANAEITRLSVTDMLTGLYNRRYLDEHLSHALKTARRYLQPLSVILCDIDHFKQVNDRYGHKAGDTVLKLFAQRLAQDLRVDVDWVARYGGEEFVCVLPHTDLQAALITAERIRMVIEACSMQVAETELQITASFGVSSFQPTVQNRLEQLSIQQLLHSADQHLYQCKHQGRNCVSGSVCIMNEEH